MTMRSLGTAARCARDRDQACRSVSRIASLGIAQGTRDQAIRSVSLFACLDHRLGTAPWRPDRRAWVVPSRCILWHRLGTSPSPPESRTLVGFGFAFTFLGTSSRCLRSVRTSVASLPDVIFGPSCDWGHLSLSLSLPAAPLSLPARPRCAAAERAAEGRCRGARSLAGRFPRPTPRPRPGIARLLRPTAWRSLIIS